MPAPHRGDKGTRSLLRLRGHEIMIVCEYAFAVLRHTNQESAYE